MVVVEPGAGPSAAGLVERAKNIILQPSAEWDRIAPEQTPAQSVFVSYVLPLAALSAVCAFVGNTVFGISVLGVTTKTPLVMGLVGAVVSIVLVMIGVFLMGMVANFLAPNFGGKQDSLQATKLAAYSATPGLLGGVASIFPPIAILGALFGLYGIYLIYKGVPKLMGAPQEKATGYTATIVVIMIVLGMVLGMLAGCVTGLGMLAGGAAGIARQASEGGEISVTTPEGKVNIDLGEMQKAAEAAAAAAAGGGAGGAAVSVDQMRALLPDSLPGGFARTEMSSGSVGQMGASGVSGVYRNGEKSIELSIGDLGAAAGLAGMAGAMGMTGERETADGYERIRSEGGRTIMEELDRSAGTASFVVITGSRFVLSASGQNVGADEVKAAVDAVGPAKLDALGKP